MNLNFSRVAFISSVITFLSSFVMFLIGVILAKILSPDIFGKYSIFRSLIIFLPISIYFGLGNSLIRTQKKTNIFEYNWKAPFNKSIIIAIYISIPLCFIFYYIYSFPLLQCMIIFISCILMGRVGLSNSILRLYEEYIKGLIVVNIWRYVYIGVLLSYIFLEYELDLNILLLIILFSSMIGCCISLHFETKIHIGDNKIRYADIFNEGFMFFLFGLSNIFLAQLDKFFIGYYQGFSYVGAYTAISMFPFTVFNIMASSIGIIAMPYLIKSDKIKVRSRQIVFYSFIIIPAVIYIFFHFFGFFLLDFIFNEKFQSNYHIFNYCNFLGLLQYLQVLSYYILGATKDNKTIKMITILNYLSILFLIPSYLLLTVYYGIIGSILSFILIWLARLFISLYYIFFNNMESEVL